MQLSKTITTLFLVLTTLHSYSQTNGTAISSDAAVIHYKIFGTGKPLLIINGGPGMNSAGFEGLAKTLSSKYQAILYDQRGTGKSVLEVVDSSTVNMKLMMDDIESIRKTLKIEKWSILGHSFGGMAASYYATLYPENIDKIILSSSGGIDMELMTYARTAIDSKLSKTDLDSVNYWTQKINAGDTSHHARLRRGIHLAPAYVLNKKYIPVIGERLTQSNWVINQLIWSDLRKINFDCAEKLKSFDRPVLIIQGKEDIIKAATAEKAHQAIRHSKVVLMEHCSHYGWLDNEKVYFREIYSFLK